MDLFLVMSCPVERQFSPFLRMLSLAKPTSPHMPSLQILFFSLQTILWQCWPSMTQYLAGKLVMRISQVLFCNVNFIRITWQLGKGIKSDFCLRSALRSVYVLVVLGKFWLMRHPRRSHFPTKLHASVPLSPLWLHPVDFFLRHHLYLLCRTAVPPLLSICSIICVLPQPSVTHICLLLSNTASKLH